MIGLKGGSSVLKTEARQFDVQAKEKLKIGKAEIVEQENKLRFETEYPTVKEAAIC